MKTYQQLWQSLTPLYDAGEAQAIVRTVLDVEYGMTLTDIIGGKVNELSADEGKKLEEIVCRLQKGEPVQYVLGQADFAGRTFHVEPGVLIPRPETAELCQWIVETQNENWEKEEAIIRKEFNISPDVAFKDVNMFEAKGWLKRQYLRLRFLVKMLHIYKKTRYTKLASPRPRIIDLCTGSGCIAITLSLDIPNSEVLGIDISDSACNVATKNAKQLASKAIFKNVDIFDLLEMCKTNGKEHFKADIIVSNPPYICEKEKAEMEKNVLEHEPAIALFVPDEDPLKFYRAIAEFASTELRSLGMLYFEINPLYEKETREMLEGFGFKDIETKEDSFGKKRMMRAMK
ncbi:MAG: HemK/PrmC family methyltransferase [Prevotella sp.]|nr:HemK/PrmC family methyltransferase [Prevotella sp.]